MKLVLSVTIARIVTSCEGCYEKVSVGEPIYKMADEKRICQMCYEERGC
jgi:formylmethanofuran dehydrogenase subunit E